MILGLVIAGVFGVLCRALLQLGLESYAPLGTWLANIFGCYLAGFLSIALQEQSVKQVVLIGFCGALTTLSSVCVETLHYWHHEKVLVGSVYFLATISLGLLISFLGMKSYGWIFPA